MPKPNKRSHYDTRNYNPGEEKKEKTDPCVKFLVDNWDSWDNHWSNKFALFDKCYDRWKGAPPKRDEDWQANFHKKLTWQAEKTLVARFHSTLFPISAPVEAEPTEATDEGYRILAKSVVGHWFKLGKVPLEFLKGMRSAAIYGTGLFEDDWYVRKEPVMERIEEDVPDYRALVDNLGNKITDDNGNIKTEQIGTRKVTRDKSRLRVVEDRYRCRKANIYAWRIHPDKLDDDDDYPVMKQEFITYDILLEREAEAEKYEFSAFENMDKIKADKFRANEQDSKRLQKEGEFIDPDNPRIEILYFWGLYADSKDAEKKPMWIAVANKKYILWKRENPYWHKKPPLFHIVWTEDEKPSYYGIGVAEIGADAEDRANTNVNIRTDMYKKNVRGSGWYNAGDKKIKKSQLQSNTPGLMRACSDPRNAVLYDNPPPIRPEDYKEEEVAVNDHREITGATTSMLPTADVGQQHKTLGGLELLVSQGVQRLKPDLVAMEMMGIRRMANRAFLLTRQFMTKEETIELIAPANVLQQMQIDKVYTMNPKQLMGGVNFFCTGLSESVEKMQNIDKALKFMEILTKLTPGHPFISYLIKRIALWLGFEDAENFFGDQPGMHGQGLLPGMPPQGIPPGMPAPAMPQPPIPPQGGGGLPPEMIAMIQQGMMNQNQAGVV